jgi:hypothetical protein
VLGARVAADISAALVQDTYSWTGGHDVSVPLGPLTVSDSFADDPGTKELNRRVALALSGPLSMETSGALEMQPTKTTRTWAAAAKAAAGTAATATSSFSASYVGDADDRLFNLPYQEAWSRAFGRLVPEDGSGERRRDFDAKAGIEVPGNALGFSGSADAGSGFNGALNTRNSRLQLQTSVRKGDTVSDPRFTPPRSRAESAEIH